MKYLKIISYVVLVLSVSNVASKEIESDFFIPSTVSEEAKKVIKSFNKKY